MVVAPSKQVVEVPVEKEQSRMEDYRPKLLISGLYATVVPAAFCEIKGRRAVQLYGVVALHVHPLPVRGLRQREDVAEHSGLLVDHKGAERDV